MKKRGLKIAGVLISIILVAAIVGGIYVYNVINTGFDIDKTVYIYIDSNKDYAKLLNDIEKTAKVQNISDFDKAASWLKYKSNLKVGRFAIKPDMNILEVIRLLRSGTQSPVKLTFNNIRTKKDLTKRISEQLMMDESSLFATLDNAQICENFGFTTETIVAMFIPNTYELYWDISIDNFLKRMNNEYKKFWTEDRLTKAKAIGLSPIKVSILASIVEEECMFADEYPIVAGLYLNRLNRKQLLQADPTVKFAVGDFTLRRILNKHLETDSPYNTYKYEGLPPGPIRIPSIKGIDSVLNYTKHDYIFMCAKEDFSGRHNFAKTAQEHGINAAKYRTELNRRGIFR